MKKITCIYLLMFILSFSISSKGQTSSYVFTNQIGTFIPNSTQATPVAGVVTDEGVSLALPIGFNFVYGAATYSQFYMSSNGFISMGSAGATISTNNLQTANASQRPIIAPLWDDLAGATAINSKASYELTGTSPNRILTIEWLNWKWNYGATTPVMSFQVKLYETTNVIEFVYRQESGAINGSPSASIGINDATGSTSGTYLNLNTDLLTATSTTSVTTIAQKPADNQVFKFSPPACLYMGALSVTNLSIPTATLNLSIPAPVNIDFYVTDSGSAPSAGTTPTGTVLTGGVTLPLTGLKESAIYRIYVKYACAAIGTGWVEALSFRTPCGGVITNNFSEDFDNSDIGSTTVATYPHCWNYIDNITSTGYGYVQGSTTYAKSGERSYVLYRTNSTANRTQDLVLISPETDNLGNGTKQLRFSVRNYTATYANKLEIITLPNAASTTGATVLTTIYPDQLTFQEYIVPLPQDTHDYFGFRLAYNGSTTSSQLYLDDIHYEDLMPCVFPMGIKVTNITTNSATISWDPSIATGVTGYEYEIRKSGAPGSGSLGLAKSGNTTGTSEDITGLDPSTRYTVYVRSKCGSTNGMWTSFPIIFGTTCVPYIGSFSEGFETSDIGNSSTNTQPYCWNTIDNITSTGYGYAQNNTSYVLSGTQSYFMYRSNSTSNQTQDLVLVSPQTDKLGSGTKQLRFSIRSYSASYINKLEIITLADNTSTTGATVLTTIYPDQLTFKEYIVPLPQNTHDYFGFRLAYNGLTTTSQIVIDDVFYEDLMPCVFPININATNITTNSATISWDPSIATGITGYEYEVRTHGNPGSGGVGLVKSDAINQTSVDILELMPCSTYSIYIRTICGTSNGSWSPFVLIFNTLTGVKNGSFFEGFENTPISSTSSNNTIPYCWSYLSTVSPISNGYGYTNNTAANNGNNGFYTYRSAAANGDLLLISPETNSLGNGTKQIRFMAKVSSSSYTSTHKFEVYTMKNTIDASQKTLVQTNIVLTTEWKEFVVRLPQTSDNYFAFSFDRTGATYVYLDDIYYEDIPLHTLNVSKNDVVCNGTSTGTVTVIPSEGLAPFTYSWFPSGGNSNVASNLPAGNYMVIVKDKADREVKENITITEPDALASGLVYTGIDCNGNTNGSASISPSGGTAPYKVLWSTGGGSLSISNLSKGQYTVTITDAKGCVLIENFNIEEPLPLLASIAMQTNVTNYQGNDGAATVSVTGGTTPYTFNWSPLGGTSDTASNLSAGTYTVFITDANGCTVNQTFVITQPPAPIEITLVSNNSVTCSGLSDGSLIVDVTGGTPPFIYSWNPSVGNSKNATNLPTGSYTILVTDSLGKTASETYIVTEPTALGANVGAIINVSCFGQNNGSATVNASGGTPPYKYRWSNGETTSVATKLFEGNNFVIVTDDNGCAVQESFTINQPPVLTVSANITNLVCNGLANGSISAIAFGGTPPYSYSWNTGQIGSVIDNLSGGIYTVTVTDANNCMLTQSFTVIEPALVHPPIAVNQGFCTNAQLSDMVITGSGIKWYDAASNGNLLPANTILTNGATYYASQTINGCESNSRTSVLVNLYQPLVLITTKIDICNNTTIQDVVIDGNGHSQLKWYKASTSATSLPVNYLLTSGIYYVSTLTNNVCESVKYPIQVNVLSIVPAPIIGLQSICGYKTFNDISITKTPGGIINWYTSSYSNNPKPVTDQVLSGTYYVEQVVGFCKSVRVAVPIQVIPITAPNLTNITVCDGVTIGDFNNPSLKYVWYLDNITSAAFADSYVIKTGSYYIAQEISGCISNRTKVDVIVNDRPANPSGQIVQTFNYAATVDDLLMNQLDVEWYGSVNDAIALTNRLPGNKLLKNNGLYYSIIRGANNCPSYPTEVKVILNNVSVGELDLTYLKYYPNPTDSFFTIEYNEVIKKIEMYSITGQKVLTREFNERQIKLDLSGYSSGAYMVRVETEKASQFIKIVKK